MVAQGSIIPSGGVSVGLWADIDWYLNQIVPITYRFPTGGFFRGYACCKDVSGQCGIN